MADLVERLETVQKDDDSLGWPSSIGLHGRDVSQ